MTAPVGTLPFTSEQSDNIERDVIKMIRNTVKELGQDWKISSSISLSTLFENNTVAYKNNGKSTQIKPDGGMLLYKNKPVALFEVKYQKAKANACERVFKYLPILIKNNIPFRNFIAVFDGPAFQKNNVGHITSQPGATYMMLEQCGCSVYNANHDTNLADKIKENILQIVKDTECSM